MQKERGRDKKREQERERETVTTRARRRSVGSISPAPGWRRNSWGPVMPPARTASMPAKCPPASRSTCLVALKHDDLWGLNEVVHELRSGQKRRLKHVVVLSSVWCCFSLLGCAASSLQCNHQCEMWLGKGGGPLFRGALSAKPVQLLPSVRGKEPCLSPLHRRLRRPLTLRTEDLAKTAQQRESTESFSDCRPQSFLFLHFSAVKGPKGAAADLDPSVLHMRRPLTNSGL